MVAENIQIDGRFAELYRKVEPAAEDWAIKLLNQVARSQILTRYLLLNETVFYPVRMAVTVIRRLLGRPRQSDFAT